MNTINNSELPAKRKKTYDEKTIAKAQCLTIHYLNHKISNTPKKFKRDGNVIDAIINKHSVYHTGDYNYCDKYQDLKATAYLIVHEAALKYAEKFADKEEKANEFPFCKFASKNLNWGLKRYVYDLNTKRLNGTLPDSDYVRKLFYQLPKEKIKNQKKDNYNKLSKTLGVSKETVEHVDSALTNYTMSGNKQLGDENSETLFDVIEDKGNVLDEIIIQKDLISKQRKLINEVLNNVSHRDREIFYSIKLNENNNYKELSSKYSISYERVRQISEKIFELVKNYIKKNLEISK